MNREETAKFEKNFILDITRALTNIKAPQDFLADMNEIFRKYMGAEAINFCELDYSTGKFKDFVRNWVYIEDKEKHMYLSNIYAQLKSTPEHFLLNGKIISYDISDGDTEKIKLLATQEDNFLYFPLYSTSKLFGFAEIYYKKPNENINFTPDFLSSLQIIFLQISTAVNNFVIQNQTGNSLNFFETMKNIAKIIENQYEINFIIPQIGEMLDRFLMTNLIYIFLKDENNKYQLVWPANCNNGEIYALTEKLNKNVNIIFSHDRHTAVLPLKNNDEIMGAIASYSSLGKLSATEIDYLEELTKQVATTIQRATAYSEILKHATLDALTGLNNRRQFEIRIKQETARSQRKDTLLCGIMLDIDYFKKINDTYGHAAGDCVLKGVANIITQTLRDYDIPCRYGGEEFFILLPMTHIDETILVAQRLRQTIESTPIDIREAKNPEASTVSVTASFGVTMYNHQETPEEFYQRTDKALYEAKVNGRNKVIAYRNINIINKASNNSNLKQFAETAVNSPKEKTADDKAKNKKAKVKTGKPAAKKNTGKSKPKDN